VLEKAYLTEQMFLDPSISVADPDYWILILAFWRIPIFFPGFPDDHKWKNKILFKIATSVSDPYSFDPDADPAF
jgi:hypothetical protein